MSLSGASSCALKQNGTLYCHGQNSNGQLGVNSVATKTTPTMAATSLAFSQVSLGITVTCGVPGVPAAASSIPPLPPAPPTSLPPPNCWGSNTQAGYGIGTITGTRLLPENRISTLWSQISMGSTTVCAIYASTSGLYCWGNTGLSPFSKVPVEVAGGGQWLAVCTFGNNVCGIQLGGTMFCWGPTNSNGQLGIGNTTAMTTPTPVAGGYTWTGIASRSEANAMCAIHTNQSLSCWVRRFGSRRPAYQTCTNWHADCGGRASVQGQNTNGVVGDGTLVDRSSPTAVLGAATWKAVSIGTNHACGISTESRLFCWVR